MQTSSAAAAAEAREDAMSELKPTIPKAFKAKVAANQKYCDELQALVEKYKNTSYRDNIRCTLERARKYIQVFDTELVSKKDFLSVKGVGDFVARILCDVQLRSTGNGANPSSNLERTSSLPSTELKANEEEDEVVVVMERSASPPSRKRVSRSTSADSQPSLKRVQSLQTAAAAMKRTASLNSLEEMEEDLGTICTEENCELLLLLDSREVGSKRDRHFFETELRTLGVPVQVQSLVLGDMLWATRNRETGKLHVCCDTIVERKTVVDLSHSIKDGRYKEQRSRLVQCGLSKMIYLVEGAVCATGLQIPQSALDTSLIHTRLSGFLVAHTDSKHDTCGFLHRVHQALRRKLGEFKMTRYNTFEAFCARSRVREAETVGEIFQAMLVQLPGSSADRARAITDVYPTLGDLMRAYQALAGEEERENMVRDLIAGAQKRKLGPVFSKTLKRFFCTREFV